VRSGYYTAAWQRLRKAVLERDGHRCQRCGKPANSVHLRPELRADHRLATEADCTTLCASCHGTIDAPRARHRARET